MCRTASNTRSANTFLSSPRASPLFLLVSAVCCVLSLAPCVVISFFLLVLGRALFQLVIREPAYDSFKESPLGAVFAQRVGFRRFQVFRERIEDSHCQRTPCAGRRALHDRGVSPGSGTVAPQRG